MAGGGEHILKELQQKVRVVSKKETSEPSAPRHAWPVDISGEEEVFLGAAAVGTAKSPGQARQRSASRDGWLIAINAEAKKRKEGLQTSRKPRIQRAPEFLQKAGTNMSYFEPEVVSLGPYHHGLPRLVAMEEHKKVAAVDYAEGQGMMMGDLYDRVRGVAGRARELYADPFDGLDEDAFANLMFLDGCFILHFIDCFVNKDDKSQSTSPHLHGFIIRDIFLLENQVPFVVLEALIWPKRVEYEKFITKIVGGNAAIPQNRTQKPPRDVERSAADGDVHEGPIHLLDLLRTRLLGGDAPPHGSCPEANWECFRSVMELKETGIRFTKSKSCSLRDISFKRARVYGHLHLPQIVVDDLTRPRFLNLIALEMCPDSRYDYGVTSYVCFLDKLIDHAEDVKELRKKEILLNGLGSDQHVADLFNELGTGLSPNNVAYQRAMMGIDGHYKNRWRVSVARMMHTHFSSPWTVISFAAAVFLTVLTVLQTFFTIFAKFTVGH